MTHSSRSVDAGIARISPLLLLLLLCCLLLPVRRAAGAAGTLDASFNLHVSRLAVDPIRPRMYATLTSSNCVAVIDTSTLKLVDIIPVGSQPEGLAESPDGSTLYIANNGSTTAGVSVINLNTLEVLPSLATPVEPDDIAAGLNGQLYLTPAFYSGQSNLMQVSTTGSSTIIGAPDSGPGDGFLQISPDFQTLYYGATGDALQSYDLTSGTAQLSQNNNAYGGGVATDLELSHSGAFISFPNGLGVNQYGAIFEIPTSNLNATNGTFAAGAGASDIAFSPDDAVAYSAPGLPPGNEMLVFDTSSCAVTGTFAVTAYAGRIKTDTSGKYLFVASNALAGSPSQTALRVYDTGRAASVITSATVVATTVGAAPTYQITATNGPLSYGAIGLPPGLSISPTTGQLSGTCTTAGYFPAFVSASNAIGVAMGDVNFTVGAPATTTLNVSVNGSGAVSTGYLGATSQVIGSTVSITATPSRGYVFAGWSGGITSPANPLSFIVESATSVQANFVPATLGKLDATFNLPTTRFALDPTRPRMYASLAASNSVAVIDTSTLSLVALIPVGPSPVGLTVSPDGSTLYVADSGATGYGVSVINLATLTVLPSLSTPAAPNDIALGAGGQLYLTPAAEPGGAPGELMQVDVASGAGSQFPVGANYYAAEGYLQISPDQKTLYYGNSDNEDYAAMMSYDVSSGSPILLQDNLNLGSHGEDLEVSHSGAFIAFPNGGGQGDYQIYEIPTNNLSGINASFAAGAYPTNIAFSPDDALAYTEPNNVLSNTVYVLQTSNCALSGSFPVSAPLSRLKTDSSGKYLFAATLSPDSQTPTGISVYETGRLASVITSATSASINTGVAFSYRITATNNPTSFNATGLPAGLSVSPVTGIISGTATTSGSYQAVVSASNAIGVAMANLAFTVTGSGATVQLSVTVNGGGAVSNGYLGTTYPDAGSAISLAATAAPGYAFNGWTGTINSSANPLAFTLNSATSLQASFVPAPPLNVSISGSGSVTNGLLGTTYQVAGSQVTLSATAAPGYVFTGWTGDVTSSANPLTFTFNSATSVQAVFSPAPALNVSVSGNGSVTSNLLGTTYPTIGSQVMLSATAAPGYVFTGWTGDITSTANPLTFAFESTTSIQAAFAPIPPSIISGTQSGLLYGAPFTYQIHLSAAAGSVAYGATGLPAGLTLNGTTGLISGTLGDAGQFDVLLSATGSNAATIYPGDLSLQIEAQLMVAAGDGGFTAPSGTSYRSIGSQVSLLAEPLSGYLFLDWTGPYTSYSNPLVVTLPDTVQWTANFLPATAYEGSYSSLLSGAVFAPDGAGFLSIRVAGSGIFTGSVVIGGVRYSVRGDFAPTNTASVLIPRRNLPPIVLNLALNIEAAPPVVTGTATNGIWTSSLSTSLATTYSSSHPCPLAGRYTVALYGSTNSQPVPAGAGYATISVSANGVASTAGTLADGTPFTASSPVAPDGTLQVYDSLYKGKGAIGGVLTFLSATSTGELSGTLDWVRPPGAATSPYPAGFSTTLAVAGSSYNHSASLSGAGTLTFTGGNVANGSASYPFTLNALGRIVIPFPGSRSVTFTLTTQNGVFSGTFLDPATREHFYGVLLQQQDTAAGFFLDPSGGGSVELSPAP